MADTPLGIFSVPGYQLLPAFDGTLIYTNIKDYSQSYDGLEFAVRKRMSRHFRFTGGFFLQRQQSHYDGGDSLAFQVLGGKPFDPTNARFVNNQPYANYSKWHLKMSGVYELPFSMQAAAFLKYQQGFPHVIQLEGFLVEPFASRRHQNIFTVDLALEKGFGLGRWGTATATLDIFNLTNANAVTQREGWATDENFNKILDFLSPRTVRLRLRYSF